MSDSSNLNDLLSHTVKPIESPIIILGYHVIDIIIGGVIFIVMSQILTVAVPEFPGSALVSYLLGIACGYGYLSSAQYLREYAPPSLLLYFAYWLRSADHYVPKNDTFTMPITPTALLRRKD